MRDFNFTVEAPPVLIQIEKAVVSCGKTTLYVQEAGRAGNGAWAVWNHGVVPTRYEVQVLEGDWEPAE